MTDPTDDGTPLALWRGLFGHGYTTRNRVDPQTRVDWFARLLKGLDLANAVEAGANRGHNLVAIRQTRPTLPVLGIEPNATARAEGACLYPTIPLVDGALPGLPVTDRFASLVLTAGVLIHVPPAQYSAALQDLARVADRYVLLVEYEAETETMVRYRETDGLLWKRPFGDDFRAANGKTAWRVRGTGDATRQDGFDACTYWLMERVEGAAR